MHVFISSFPGDRPLGLQLGDMLSNTGGIESNFHLWVGEIQEFQFYSKKPKSVTAFN